jgi:osmotically-inducible protein OsmY
MRKIFILSTILISLLSTSCAPVIVAGVAGGAILYDTRSLATIYQDEEITHQVMGNLKQSEELTNSQLDVATLDHTVLLVGRTENKNLKSLAYQIASKTNNVSHVYNQITIGDNLSPLTISKDTWITTKAKSALLAALGAQSSQIKVLTEGSNVYLMGIVTKTKSDIATETVSGISGVNKVVRLFQIIKDS